MWLINVVVIITFVFNILQIVSKAVKEEKAIIYGVIGFAVFFEIIFVLNINSDKQLSSIMQVLILVFSYLIPMFLVAMKSLGKNLKMRLVYCVAKILYNLNKYELVDMLLEKAITQDKQNIELYCLRGQVLVKMDSFEKAVDMFFNAIELGCEDKEVYYEVADILDRLDKKDTAIVMLGQALNLDENYIEAKELLAIIYSEIGAVKEAINIYESIIASDKANVDTYFNLAVLYTSKNQINKAIILYEKALELDNELYSASYSVGRLYYLTGEYVKAKNAFLNALNDETLTEKVKYSLALVNVKLNEQDEAINNLRTAIELNNDYWEYAKREPILEQTIYSLYSMNDNNC